MSNALPIQTDKDGRVAPLRIYQGNFELNRIEITPDGLGVYTPKHRRIADYCKWATVVVQNLGIPIQLTFDRKKLFRIEAGTKWYDADNFFMANQ